MTIINRKHGFVYLKSRKTAGTAVEAYLLTRTSLGADIWNTARNIRKYGLPRHRRHVLVGALAGKVFTAPNHERFGRLLPWSHTIREHHPAEELARLLGSFWDRALKVTNVRNPWDIMVSGWQWRREGRGISPPVTASFDEWGRACLADDAEWQERVHAYDARDLMHPFIFLDGQPVADVLIRQEAINEGIAEVGRRLGLSLSPLKVRENETSRKRDYRIYYSDDLAEAVRKRFADIVELCGYRFDP